MAFTGSFIPTSVKKEWLFGAHDYDPSTGDTFKIALYTDAATLDAATTAYSATNEISGTGYSAGGIVVVAVAPASSGTTAFVDFADATWAGASFTARGALIYNTTPNTTSISLTNPAVAIIDFGSNKTVSANTFSIQFPVASASTAIVRIA